MARKENIDRLLRDWPYDPQGISVRKKKGDDGREVLQMRLDLGLLQLETKGRPDGTRPQGAENVLRLSDRPHAYRRRRVRHDGGGVRRGRPRVRAVLPPADLLAG